MPAWNEHTIHSSMHVKSADNQDLGHVAKVYQDSFLVHKGIIFPSDRYFPYSAIASVDNDEIHLNLTLDEAQSGEWNKRPDYEDHLGDPLQLMYDRGHGVADPFDEENPDKA